VFGAVDSDNVDFLQAGTGAVATDVQSKLRETVSVKDFGAVGDGVTDDTDEVKAAVTYCYTNGVTLYWPTGDYVVSTTVPNLHEVKHLGVGTVTNGLDTFYVNPKESESNTLYVSTTGVIANDGLTSSQATTPKQAAIWLENYGTVLDGVWTVKFAAGTYNQANTGFDVSFSGFTSANRVVFKGPSVGASPAVPTAIFDGTGGSDYEHGLRVGGVGFKVQVQDIKFINFTSSNTRIGLVGENEVDFYTVNVHADNCDWCGVYAFNTVRARVSGGILNACRSGFIANSTQCTIAYTDVTNATESGIYWSRGSQGHVDYCTLTSNAIGLIVAENSRVDTIDNVFTSNNYAIRTQTGGVFGEGGVANTYTTSVIQDLEFKAHSGDSNELRFSSTELRVASDRTTISHSGAVATDLTTPYTIPAGRMNGVNKTCRVKIAGVFNTTTAGSVISIKFGAALIDLTVTGAGSSSIFLAEVELHEVQGGYRAFGKLEQNLASTRHVSNSGSFDKTIDQDVVVAANLADAGDSITIYRTDVFITG